jgi:hypothetical protein
MSKPITYKFRVHTGQFNADGEICMMFCGGRLVPDDKEKDSVWLTTPKGEKVFLVKKSMVDPVDNREMAEALLDEAEIIRRSKNAHNN